jgi:predicted transcriptional regulator of viral defense system
MTTTETRRDVEQRILDRLVTVSRRARLGLSVADVADVLALEPAEVRAVLTELARCGRVERDVVEQYGKLTIVWSVRAASVAAPHEQAAAE